MEAEKIRQTRALHRKIWIRVCGELSRFEEERREVLAGMEENERQMQEKEGQIRSLTESCPLPAWQGARAAELQTDLERKEALSAKQKRFFSERESLSETVSGLDKEVYRLNAQREKTEEAIESQINYMWDEYELTLTGASALRDEALQDLGAMKKEIASLKDEIRRLGDVNVNAIEIIKI